MTSSNEAGDAAADKELGRLVENFITAVLVNHPSVLAISFQILRDHEPWVETWAEIQTQGSPLSDASPEGVLKGFQKGLQDVIDNPNPGETRIRPDRLRQGNRKG